MGHPSPHPPAGPAHTCLFSGIPVRSALAHLLSRAPLLTRLHFPKALCPRFLEPPTFQLYPCRGHPRAPSRRLALSLSLLIALLAHLPRGSCFSLKGSSRPSPPGSRPAASSLPRPTPRSILAPFSTLVDFLALLHTPLPWHFCRSLDVPFSRTAFPCTLTPGFLLVPVSSWAAGASCLGDCAASDLLHILLPPQALGLH